MRLARRLRQAGVASPEAEAWTMLERASGADRLCWLTDPGRTLDPAAQRRLEAWTAGRAAGVPLQQLLGAVWFYELDLAAGPEALVPRVETEVLVALALASLRGRTAPRVLDVGTGSGAIAVALAHARPDATVHASDVDAAALALAATNARRHAPGVTLHHADLLHHAELRTLLPTLDLLVANLPYLPDGDADRLPADVRRDPPLALFGGPDGLDPFRRLWAQATEGPPNARLAAGAHAWFELDPRNVDAAEAWVNDRAQGARPSGVHADLTGRRRFLHLGSAGGPAGRDDAAAPSPPTAAPPRS
ncbi:MAG: HemK/PrmC family methyltransferase [Trueperaceae bacterium]